MSSGSLSLGTRERRQAIGDEHSTYILLWV